MGKRVTSLPIREWALDDKPREKLIQNGSALLSNAELLAILIGSGSQENSAVALSKIILDSTGQRLSALGKYSLEQLCQFKGIGKAKAVTIMAALEISRRCNGEEHRAQTTIKDSEAAYRVLAPKLSDLPHEEFWILYLNNANRVILAAQLSKGGITGTLVDVRLVLRKALEIGAVALILAHNHPSGNLQPSNADKQLTQKLKEAVNVFDIKILDHLIITQQHYFSFADQNVVL